MFGAENAEAGVATVAHIIQGALTPVFLLSGIATLLNVFSTRLARVADQVEAASRALAMADTAEIRLLERQLRNLYRRSLALDTAVVLAAIGGAATCASVLTLFIGSLRETRIEQVLFGLFGLAVVSALGGVLAFTVEMMIAGIGIREEVAESQRAARARLHHDEGATHTARGVGRQPGASD
jgi:Protein of unknown function (DUF2721)